ncbi:hypothetical protein DIPPA_21966 [Diplonema papillatum]|nr:hypothetical protein DIPPA_21966 [Diplonema papillatum]
MAGFSASLQLTGLDYIAPSQACVLPLLPAEEVGSVMRHDKRAKGAESKVKLDLADCLACSGCVTTAETMLVQEQSLGASSGASCAASGAASWCLIRFQRQTGFGSRILFL